MAILISNQPQSLFIYKHLICTISNERIMLYIYIRGDFFHWGRYNYMIGRSQFKYMFHFDSVTQIFTAFSTTSQTRGPAQPNKNARQLPHGICRGIVNSCACTRSASYCTAATLSTPQKILCRYLQVKNPAVQTN